MHDAPPPQLLLDALARIGAAGELLAATPVMAKWLERHGVARLDELPLDVDQHAALLAGLPVLLAMPNEVTELQRLPYGGELWLRVRDVADRQRAEAAMAAAARVRALGALAGSIAHDLNNQLNSALGLATVLAPLVVDGQEREALRAMEKAVVRGARLADTTARLLLRSPDPRRDRAAIADAAAVIDDVMAIVGKLIDLGQIGYAVAPTPTAPLWFRAAHDAAVHNLMVGVNALLEARPASLRFAVLGERRAIADGREREVVVIRVECVGLAADRVAALTRLVAAEPGLLAMAVGSEALAALLAATLQLRRGGGELRLTTVGDTTRVEWVWPQVLRRR